MTTTLTAVDNAGNTIPLPTLDEIKAATEVLSGPETSRRVVKIGPYAVKSGKSVSLAEVENTKFVAEHCSFRVPKIYSTFRDPEDNRKHVIMEYIDGRDLSKAWPDLSDVERSQVIKKLKAAIDEFRSLPDPGFIGSLGHTPCLDNLFFARRTARPEASGPFDTEEEMADAFTFRLGEREKPEYMEFLRRCIMPVCRGHTIKFTHGDLQLKNIIVTRDAVKEGELGVAIIDWETSGWYPEFWDFCAAAYVGRRQAGILEVIEGALEPYHKEFPMMALAKRIKPF